MLFMFRAYNLCAHTSEILYIFLSIHNNYTDLSFSIIYLSDVYCANHFTVVHTRALLLYYKAGTIFHPVCVPLTKINSQQSFINFLLLSLCSLVHSCCHCYAFCHIFYFGSRIRSNFILFFSSSRLKLGFFCIKEESQHSSLHVCFIYIAYLFKHLFFEISYSNDRARFCFNCNSLFTYFSIRI